MSLALRSVIEWHIALSAAAALVVGWSGVGESWSLVAGAAWALMNLFLWAVIVRTLVRVRQGGTVQKRLRWMTWGAVTGKIGLFLALGAALLLKLPVEPVSFAAGVAVLTLAFVLSSVVSSTRRPAWKEA